MAATQLPAAGASDRSAGLPFILRLFLCSCAQSYSVTLGRLCIVQRRLPPARGRKVPLQRWLPTCMRAPEAPARRQLQRPCLTARQEVQMQDHTGDSASAAGLPPLHAYEELQLPDSRSSGGSAAASRAASSAAAAAQRCRRERPVKTRPAHSDSSSFHGRLCESAVEQQLPSRSACT